MNLCPVSRDIANHCNQPEGSVVTRIDTACVPAALVRLMDLYRPTHLSSALNHIAAWYLDTLLDEGRVSGSVTFYSPEENREISRANLEEAFKEEPDNVDALYERALNDPLSSANYIESMLKEMAITFIWQSVSDYEQLLEAA